VIEELSLAVLTAAAGAADPRAWYDDQLFNTLVTLGLGTLIVNWLKTRWRREEKKLDKTLEFLESTGDRLNHLLSLIFNSLITHNLSDERLAELRALRRPVFEKRFSVRLGAEALLGSQGFSGKYDILANQLFSLIELLPRKAKGEDEAAVLAEIGRKTAELAEEWPLESVASAVHRHPQVLDDEVLAEVQRWARMIWERALDLISGPLKREIG
jgi:hypothetical protein